MSSTLHMLKAILQTDVSGFARGMKTAAGGTDELTQKWKEAGQAISSAANRISLAVTGMATAIAVKFGEFESTMTRAGAVTRTLGTKDFKLLEDAAKKMGETTVFSASQSAQAIEVMGLAGLKTSEIIEALPGALQLAAAGSVDIATAANAAAKTMRAFGADASELGHINDVLVGTFTRANTDLLMLTESLKHVAPVSKGLNVSLEDTAAVLAKMADAGFQGSIGGTSLRNIMTRLAGAVPAATKQLRALGVETIDLATNKMRPLFDILQDIERSGISEGQLLQIFGARGGPQLLAVLESGTDSLRQFSQELSNMGGIAKEVADAQLNTLSGAWKLFQSQIESFLISAGEKLAPTLRKAADEVQRFLTENKADIVKLMTTAVEGLVTAFRSMVRWATQNSAVLTSLGSAFTNIITVFGRLAGMVPQLTTALVALRMGGMLGLTGAVQSLGSALVATVGRMAGLQAAVAGAGAASATAAPALAGILGSAGVFAVGAGAIWAAVTALDAYSKSLKNTIELEHRRKLEQIKAQREEEAANEKSSRQFKVAHLGGSGGLTQFASEITRQQKRLQEVRREQKATEGLNKEREKIKSLLHKTIGITKEERKSLTAQEAELRQQIEKRKARFAGAEDEIIEGLNETVAEFRKAIVDRFQREMSKSPQGEEFRKEMETQLAGVLSPIDRPGTGFDQGKIAVNALRLIQQIEAANAKVEGINNKLAGKAGGENQTLQATRRQLAEQDLAKRKTQAGPELSRVSELLQQPNLSKKAVELIGQSMEGATKESTDQLVKQFDALKQTGQLTTESIELVVLQVLDTLEKAKGKAQQVQEDAQRVTGELIRFQTDVATSQASDPAKMQAQQGGFQLQSDFNSGGITLEIFRQRLAALRQELQNSINKANQKITAQQQLDNTIGSQLSKFNAKVEQFFGRLPFDAITQMKSAAQQLGTAFEAGKISLDKFKVKLQQMLQQANQAANAVVGGGGGGAGGGGGLGGFFNGLQNFLNRPVNMIGGDALGWTRGVAESFGHNIQDAAQGFKDTVESTNLSPIQQIYDALAPTPIPFVGVSGQTGSVEGGGGNTFNQHIHVQKLSDSEFSRLFSRMQDEASRRGRPF